MQVPRLRFVATMSRNDARTAGGRTWPRRNSIYYRPNWIGSDREQDSVANSKVSRELRVARTPPARAGTDPGRYVTVSFKLHVLNAVTKASRRRRLDLQDGRRDLRESSRVFVSNYAKTVPSHKRGEGCMTDGKQNAKEEPLWATRHSE